MVTEYYLESFNLWAHLMAREHEPVINKRALSTETHGSGNNCSVRRRKKIQNGVTSAAAIEHPVWVY